MIEKSASYRTPCNGRLPHLLLVVVMVLVIAGCGLIGGGEGEDVDIVPQTGEGQAAQEPQPNAPAQVTLTCSAECLNREQCGTTTEGQQVILLSRDVPAVDPTQHDFVVPADTSVSVLTQQTLDVIEVSTGQQFPVNFFLVSVPAQGEQGWAASWCLAGLGQ